MKKFGKIVGINLIGLIVYSLVIRIAARYESSQGRSDEILLDSAIAVGIHVIICLLVSLGTFASRDNENGRNWLGTAGVVLVVGFSVCLGNAALG
jgi:predicted transporter